MVYIVFLDEDEDKVYTMRYNNSDAYLSHVMRHTYDRRG